MKLSLKNKPKAPLTLSLSRKGRGDNGLRSLVVCLLMILTGPVLAAHGPMTTNDRDPWINAKLNDLISQGWVETPDKPVKDLTNLQVAQLTKNAAEVWMAQAPAVPGDPLGSTQAPEGKDIKALVEEFQTELAVMELDVRKLEDRIYDEKHLNEKFAAMQMKDLKLTGTNLTGTSRAYFDTYRGLGTNPIFGPLDYNDIMMGDIILKSVPVPFVLFDVDLRMTRTIGLYYADPISPNVDLRWISLTNTNDICNITAGDNWRHYTPLTLWNSEIPVYTMIEPTSYYRTRKDIEELVYMDHGPDQHLRGFELASDQNVDKNPILSSFHLQAMGGELSTAATYSFAKDYVGSEASVNFFDEDLELKAAGLLLFDDKGTANVPYIPSLLSTFARTYRIGSLSSNATLPIDKDIDVKGFGEWAGSWFQDDSQNPLSVIQDWALLAKGSVDVYGGHLTVKYLNNGTFFYSPGAQTNRYSANPGQGYLVGNQNLDDGLNGYLNSYVFQGIGRPVFAPYDRMAENMLPYGDATPNREGAVLGLSGEIGQNGWLKPQASLVLSMQEIQPNYVLTPSGVSVLPVDSNMPVTNVRKFGGYEGALTLDIAKALEGAPSTCDISGDYKHQTTDLGTGASPFTVNTLIICADAGPFPGVPLFEGLVLSGAYEQAKSSGSEYVLTGIGTPPTLANYASYFDTGSLGTYSLQALNITRTSWAAGIKCPISKTIEVHGDWFHNQYTWTDQPAFDRHEQIWRLTYELTF